MVTLRMFFADGERVLMRDEMKKHVVKMPLNAIWDAANFPKNKLQNLVIEIDVNRAIRDLSRKRGELVPNDCPADRVTVTLEQVIARFHPGASVPGDECLVSPCEDCRSPRIALIDLNVSPGPDGFDNRYYICVRCAAAQLVLEELVLLLPPTRHESDAPVGARSAKPPVTFTVIKGGIDKPKNPT